MWNFNTIILDGLIFKKWYFFMQQLCPSLKEKMSAIWNLIFKKRKQLRLSEVNYLNYTNKTRPNFACDNYIFPKNRGETRTNSVPIPHPLMIQYKPYEGTNQTANTTKINETSLKYNDTILKLLDASLNLIGFWGDFWDKIKLLFEWKWKKNVWKLWENHIKLYCAMSWNSLTVHFFMIKNK